MIDLLLRCYPARWRARDGDEFAAVLEVRPLSPFDVADVLLGALDAHLHLRGRGAAPQHAKGLATGGLGLLARAGTIPLMSASAWYIAWILDKRPLTRDLPPQASIDLGAPPSLTRPFFRQIAWTAGALSGLGWVLLGVQVTFLRTGRPRTGRLRPSSPAPVDGSG